MPDAAITKVETAAGDILKAWPALSSWTVIDDPKADEAVKGDTLTVYTTGYKVAHSEEQGQSRHRARMEFEVVSRKTASGTISRRNQEALAHVLAALAADRTFGGIIEDFQEIDVAPVEADGRDRGAASLQAEVTFYTPRDDWFTIVGIGGTHF